MQRVLRKGRIKPPKRPILAAPGREQTAIARQPLTRGALALNVLAVAGLGVMPNVLLALCTSLMG